MKRLNMLMVLAILVICVAAAMKVQQSQRWNRWYNQVRIELCHEDDEGFVYGWCWQGNETNFSLYMEAITDYYGVPAGTTEESDVVYLNYIDEEMPSPNDPKQSCGPYLVRDVDGLCKPCAEICGPNKTAEFISQDPVQGQPSCWCTDRPGTVDEPPNDSTINLDCIGCEGEPTIELESVVIYDANYASGSCAPAGTGGCLTDNIRWSCEQDSAGRHTTVLDMGPCPDGWTCEGGYCFFFPDSHI